MTPVERAEATANALRGRLNWRDPEGRLIWAYLAEHCHMADAGPTHDALELARREGRRALFIHLAGIVSLPLIPEV